MSDYDDIVRLIKSSTRELDGEAKVLCVIDAVGKMLRLQADGASMGILLTTLALLSL